MDSAKEYIVSQEELKKMQRIEFSMLKEVDRICRKYNIAYSLDGGTLLGAVRHKGFIPWDDDIDVIMLREEYARFKDACKKELDSERFFLQDYQTDPEYRWGWAKIRRKNTEHIRLGQESMKYKTGIFIDIFVADQVPDNPIIKRVHHFICYMIRKILYSPLGIEHANNVFERSIYRCLNLITKEQAFAIRDWLASQSNKKKSKLISHYTFQYPKSCKYGLPRKCFDEFIEIEFEGQLFKAFKEYDIYLRSHYGNYMELPPAEKRIPHCSVSRIDMTKVEE